MTASEQTQEWRDIFYCSRDALRLYARHYPVAGADTPIGRPALCLPGLTRNAKDFHVLARYLCGEADTRRQVFCLDYRGRGRSARDPDWRNYTPYIELLDVLDFMTIAGLHQAAVIGTSRGGLITMAMSVMRPTAIGVAVLNDIGPVIESAGLLRIAGYVGKTPLPASWDEAAVLAKKLNQAFFPAIGDAEWAQIARQWFADRNGRPACDYDSNLGQAFAGKDLTSAPPAMWAQFTALSTVPTLCLRGERSDLLQPQTVSEMAKRHPRFRSMTVKGQGHAPLLRDAPTNERIAAFLAEHDGAHP